MASMLIPVAISSITFTTSGVKGSLAGSVSGLAAAEVDACVQDFSGGQPIPVISAANGNMTIKMPTVITSITINGNVYAVAGGEITAVLPVDANAILHPRGEIFKLQVG